MGEVIMVSGGDRGNATSGDALNGDIAEGS